MARSHNESSSSLVEGIGHHRASYWERYCQLDRADHERLRTLGRYYVLMIVYAVAPFSVHGLTPLNAPTPFLRVWAFGGIWLAIVMWILTDRSWAGHSENMLERVYCLRQLRQFGTRLAEACNYTSSLLNRGDGAGTASYRGAPLPGPIPRRWQVWSWLTVPLYWREGRLTRSEERRPRALSGDPIFVDQRRVTYTSYFLKLITLFGPMYLLLFIAVLAFPDIMVSPRATGAVATAIRLQLALSLVLWAWIYAGHRRCRHLMECAHRAKKVALVRGWPLFPPDHLLRPSTWLGRVLYYGFRHFLALGFGVCVLNLVVGIAHYAEWLRWGAFPPSKWWGAADVVFAWLTGGLLLILFLFSHFDTVRWNRAASDADPAAAGAARAGEPVEPPRPSSPLAPSPQAQADEPAGAGKHAERWGAGRRRGAGRNRARPGPES